ncbi:MAG: hypothetical protein ACC628_07390 [Pirellulaceae bacterium]
MSMRNGKSAAFGSNAIRLSPREWVVTCLLVSLVTVAVPRAWKHCEPFAPGPDYRIPYALSEDYWVFQRVVTHAAEKEKIAILGDSVVWGEYVTPTETLSHYLNAKPSGSRFVNGGVNGAHPLALAGLIGDGARILRGRPVLLHCNLLWMSSKERDLQTEEEFGFNHPRLVPQFKPWIPSYKAPIDERLGNVVDRNLTVRRWVHHLRVSSFQNQDVQIWSLEHPYANPITRIWQAIPNPANASHSPAAVWTERGITPRDIPWIDLAGSLQWQAFQGAVLQLQRRNCRVFVLVGPFNEHLLTAGSQRRYQGLKESVRDWLVQKAIPHYAPPPLPSDEYADASHPIRAGYERLAESLSREMAFQDWLRVD